MTTASVDGGIGQDWKHYATQQWVLDSADSHPMGQFGCWCGMTLMSECSWVVASARSWWDCSHAASIRRAALDLD